MVKSKDYQPPLFFRNRHLNTVYPALFRKIGGVTYQRQRITTPDQDFLDLDWSKVGSEKLVILLHGLEGSADRPYIRGMAKVFNLEGWDAVGINFRSCSGEPNWLLRSYHMGVSDDLDVIVKHAIGQGYRQIALIGFSLGGNVLLKFLGEQGRQVASELVGAVAYSVPCHITSANVEIDKWFNRVYLKRFLDGLNAKVKEKSQRFPDKIDFGGPIPRNFQEFDDRFTAPIHGFKDARDYWESCSSLYFLDDICVPCLIVNAKDDSFLSEQCYPHRRVDANKYLQLETPDYGGHVGFVTVDEEGFYWSERRALDFIRSL